MTFMQLCRTLALQESRALRGYAKAGIPPPRYAPTDWDTEWRNHRKANTSTFTKDAA
jgi:hypothetical protein